MNKLVAILIFLLIYIKPSLAIEPFCGWSTNTTCFSDSDCQVTGCSGQVCGKIGEEVITSCEWKECYEYKNYNLTCQCINNKCQWGYSNKISTPSQDSGGIEIKKIFFGVLGINPLIFLISGIILIFLAKIAKFIGIILLILGLIGFVFWFI